MPKCQNIDCNNKVILIVGDCKWCSKKFCGTHRLPEEHLCEGLKDMKDSKFSINAKKLMNEKCVAINLR